MSNKTLDLFKTNLQLNALLSGQDANLKLKKAPKWLHPTAAEQAYRKELRNIVTITNNQVKELLIPALPAIIQEYNTDKITYDSIERKVNLDAITYNDIVGLDNFVDTINSIFNQISLNVKNQMPNPKKLADAVGLDISTYNSDQFHKMIKQVFGADMFVSEPWLSSQLDLFATANVELIVDLPAKELAGVKQITMAGIGSGRSASAMAKDITKQFGVAERRANTIARDQVSKLNGQLTGLRQQSIGITKYTWQTSEDERVRETHEENADKTYNWSQPPTDTGNPGNEINCRCTAIPVIPGA